MEFCELDNLRMALPDTPVLYFHGWAEICERDLSEVKTADLRRLVRNNLAERPSLGFRQNEGGRRVIVAIHMTGGDFDVVDAGRNG